MDRPWDEGNRYRAIKGAIGMRPKAGGAAGQITPAAILKRIGAILKASQTRAFQEQRRGAVAWPPRKVPNVMGIVADLARNENPPARRFEATPAGIDRHDLERSIDFQPIGDDTVQVGSLLSYANLIHKGGESESPPITREMQIKLWGIIRSSRTTAQKQKERKYANARAQREDAKLTKLTDDLAREKLDLKGLRKEKNTFGAGLSSAAIKKLRTQISARKAELRQGVSAHLNAKPSAKGLKEKTKAGIGAVRWLLNPKFTGQRLKTKVPARPFATLEPEDTKTILELVGVMVTKA